jgi:hypothetical protein
MSDERRTPGGKGDRSRIRNLEAYRKAFDRVNWNDMPPEVEEILLEEDRDRRVMDEGEQR